MYKLAMALGLLALTIACAADASDEADVREAEDSIQALSKPATSYKQLMEVRFRSADLSQVETGAETTVEEKKCVCKCSTETCSPAGCGTIDCGPAVVVNQ